MFSTSDTIVAIATPPGRGGIGVVRLSGVRALAIAGTLAARTAPFAPRHATLVRLAARACDLAIITAFPAPGSYTGDDVAEISAHGSPVLLESIVAEAMRLGARLAAPGEFTLRAYLNGRIDLVQAEAVRDLVDAVTPLQARAAFDQLDGTLTRAIGEIATALFDLTVRLEASLDFPDEGYHFITPEEASRSIHAAVAAVDRVLEDSARGRMIRDGLHVVLTGPPNSGKSSLFNRLAGAGRAIVTDMPGTTRDLVTETVDIGGVPVTLVDTAGVRPAPADAIEAEGIARAVAARTVAAVVLVVLDGSVPLTEFDGDLLSDTAREPSLVVANKRDLTPAWADAGRRVWEVSAKTGEGIDALRQAILAEVVGESRRPDRDVPAITNLRHIDLLTRARAALERAARIAMDSAPEEFVVADLNDARALLEEITGTRTPDDVLDRIFQTFCIGK